LYAITSSSDSGAALMLLARSAASSERGNFCSRSSRNEELPAASARRAPTWVALASGLVPVALPSASRPARPAASRVGSTMPVRSELPVVILVTRSDQASFLSGQPTFSAMGVGMATTTGLCAIEVPSVGTKPEASELSRISQVDESGSHTSGTSADLPAGGRPVSVTPCLSARAEAVVAGLTPVTFTATQVPLTLAPPELHC
jgi:hypothetical protein